MGKRGPKPLPIAGRILAKVEVQPDGCWLWVGATNGNGYGQIGVAGSTRSVHRVAYEAFVGPIPEGLDVDHVCHNRDLTCPGGRSCIHRRCANPAHLAPATRSANLSNSGRLRPADLAAIGDRQAAKTECPSGHPYDETNTYSPPSRPTARYCRECHREHTRARRARLRESR